MCQKYFEEKLVNLLLIGEENKKYYVLIKDFNTFMYIHFFNTLYRGRKRFYHCCLQGFSTEETLKYHVKDCFKINEK